MVGRSIHERINFYPNLEIMEVDFSGMTFTSVDQVDQFYDEADRRLAESRRQWYFLVNYVDCDVRPEVWDQFASRGKDTNSKYSLGTFRVGASAATHETIRRLSKQEKFRSNLFDHRDEALRAIKELRRKRHAGTTGEMETYLRVDNIHLNFGGVRALQGVGFSVRPGEIFSIIGPNGAGKTSMLNVISGFYRPSEGQITFEGNDRTHLATHAVARLGFARTFQNIALFKGMSTLDNIMSGSNLKMRRNFLW